MRLRRVCVLQCDNTVTMSPVPTSPCFPIHPNDKSFTVEMKGEYNGHSMDTQWTLNGHYNGHSMDTGKNHTFVTRLLKD